MSLKHFSMDICASSGAASADETREALGAFLLAKAGYTTDIAITETQPDETFVFAYKGRVWRLSFILVFDVRLGMAVPFRIHFDYIKKEECS